MNPDARLVYLPGSRLNSCPTSFVSKIDHSFPNRRSLGLAPTDRGKRLFSIGAFVMRTMCLLIAVVAPLTIGAIGGFDYAGASKINDLPTHLTSSAPSCCVAQSDCCA